MPSRARSPARVMLAMGIGMGYAVHVACATCKGQVEEWSESLIIDYIQGKADAMKERTRIGDIGKVKLSDRILMRVVPQGPRSLVLLREGDLRSLLQRHVAELGAGIQAGAPRRRRPLDRARGPRARSSPSSVRCPAAKACWRFRRARTRSARSCGHDGCPASERCARGGTPISSRWR
jgi:hypothetical protein